MDKNTLKHLNTLTDNLASKGWLGSAAVTDGIYEVVLTKETAASPTDPSRWESAQSFTINLISIEQGCLNLQKTDGAYFPPIPVELALEGVQIAYNAKRIGHQELEFETTFTLHMHTHETIYFNESIYFNLYRTSGANGDVAAYSNLQCIAIRNDSKKHTQQTPHTAGRDSIQSDTTTPHFHTRPLHSGHVPARHLAMHST